MSSSPPHWPKFGGATAPKRAFPFMQDAWLWRMHDVELKRHNDLLLHGDVYGAAAAVRTLGLWRIEMRSAGLDPSRLPMALERAALWAEVEHSGENPADYAGHVPAIYGRLDQISATVEAPPLSPEEVLRAARRAVDQSLHDLDDAIAGLAHA